MIERAAIVIVAVAAIALLGAGYTAARAEDDLAALGVHTPRPTAADVKRATGLEQRAGRATAGERRILLLAPILGSAGQARRAARLLEGAVRREPENAEAWLLLSRAARGATARRAAQRVRELAPPVPEPG